MLINVLPPLQAIQFLKDMVDGKEIDVFTTARLTDQSGFYGEVFVNDVNVGEKMVENSFCFKVYLP